MNTNTEIKNCGTYNWKIIVNQLACTLMMFNILPTTVSADELHFDLVSISEARSLYRDASGNWIAPAPGKDISLPQLLSTVLSAGLFYDREAGKDRQLLRLHFNTENLLPANGWEYHESSVKLVTAVDEQGNSLAPGKGYLTRDKNNPEQGHLNIALAVANRASTKLHLAGDASITEISTPEHAELALPLSAGPLQNSTLQRYGVDVHFIPHRKGSFKFPEYPVVTFKINGDIASFRTLKLTSASGKKLQKGEMKQSTDGENQLLVTVELWKSLPEGSRLQFELGKPQYRTQLGHFSITDIPLP